MTDDQLAGLLDTVRRCIRDAPRDTWPPDVLQAARVVTTAVSARLAEKDRD